jgi:hypothetical protein
MDVDVDLNLVANVVAPVDVHGHDSDYDYV